jgi:hypothetical protein
VLLRLVCYNRHHEGWGCCGVDAEFGVAIFPKGRLSGVIAGEGCEQRRTEIEGEICRTDESGNLCTKAGVCEGGSEICEETSGNKSGKSGEKKGGVLVTKSFLMMGSLHLTLNACIQSATRGGSLYVDVVGEGLLEGADPLVTSDPMSGVQGAQLEVRWKIGSDAGLDRIRAQSRSGTKHYLRFHMANAALYGFEAAGEIN